MFLMQLIRILFICLVCCTTVSLCALFFPTNSAYGIFAAIAVPLDLPHRNVFVSYNFEANYNLPATWSIPPILAGIQDEDVFEARHDDLGQCTNCTEDTSSSSTTTTTSKPSRNATEEEESRQSKSLLTRTHFYHILKDKFERTGFKGEPCLLRLICETNASGVGEVNGVLGTLMHIIFSPSTSENEKLPLHYYQAELDGTHAQCEHYGGECQESILDLISIPLQDIINSLTKNK